MNCGLLQTGTDDDVIQDVKRTFDQGMVRDSRGFIFSTSNCVYTGMHLDRYNLMLRTFRKYEKIKMEK